MPELPEAETIARQLNASITGRTVRCAVVLRSDIIHGDSTPLPQWLPGRRIARVSRRAKRVLLEFESQEQLVFHLGMSGRLFTVRSDRPVEKHTHLRVQFQGDDMELRFRDPRRFGGVWCLRNGQQHVGRSLGPLGAEPLTLRAPEFREMLRRRRQIKALLMDQHVVVGLGNIYCDESLHAAGIHPLQRASELTEDDATRLLRAVKSTLLRAIRKGGSTLLDYRQADGEPGLFQLSHRVYGREGMNCRRCGGTILRIQAAGRSTHYCPHCQRRRSLRKKGARHLRRKV